MYWLVPGILLAPIFVVLLASIHACAPEPQKIFSRIGLALAVAYAVVIGVDYFVQFAVVIPSLRSGETQGLSLFTQYNPHWLFIAGEALGYLMMSTALLFAAPVFVGGRISARSAGCSSPVSSWRSPLSVASGWWGTTLSPSRWPSCRSTGSCSSRRGGRV